VSFNLSRLDAHPGPYQGQESALGATSRWVWSSTATATVPRRR